MAYLSVAFARNVRTNTYAVLFVPTLEKALIYMTEQEHFYRKNNAERMDSQMWEYILSLHRFIF